MDPSFFSSSSLSLSLSSLFWLSCILLGATRLDYLLYYVAFLPPLIPLSPQPNASSLRPFLINILTCFTSVVKWQCRGLVSLCFGLLLSL